RPARPQPLTSHAIQDLQQQGAQQVLGRDRRSAQAGIVPIELPVDHPLRPMRTMVDAILAELSPHSLLEQDIAPALGLPVPRVRIVPADATTGRTAAGSENEVQHAMFPA